MAQQEREILELAVRTIAQQAAKTDTIVDEALAAGLGGSDPITVHVKMLRQELLDVKRDLEREVETLVLDCTKCGQTVHWVAGLGVSPGHWAHREPAPHGEPVISMDCGPRKAVLAPQVRIATLLAPAPISTSYRPSTWS